MRPWSSPMAQDSFTVCDPPDRGYHPLLPLELVRRQHRQVHRERLRGEQPANPHLRLPPAQRAVVHHQEVHVAFRPRLSPCSRAKENHPRGMVRVHDLRDDLIHQFVHCFTSCEPPSAKSKSEKRLFSRFPLISALPIRVRRVRSFPFWFRADEWEW